MQIMHCPCLAAGPTKYKDWGWGENTAGRKISFPSDHKLMKTWAWQRKGRG